MSSCTLTSTTEFNRLFCATLTSKKLSVICLLLYKREICKFKSDIYRFEILLWYIVLHRIIVVKRKRLILAIKCIVRHNTIYHMVFYESKTRAQQIILIQIYYNINVQNKNNICVRSCVWCCFVQTREIEQARDNHYGCIDQNMSYIFLFLLQYMHI